MKGFITLTALLALGFGNVANAQVAFTEDFESVTTPALPASWTQDKTYSAAKGWETRTSAITYSGSGTSWVMKAHTKFAAIDDWNNSKDTNNTSTLITSAFDMSSLSTPFLSFDCYYVGAVINSGTKPAEKFTIEVSTNGGTTWTQLGAAVTGNSADWEPRYFDMSAYKGETSVQIAFKYSDANAKLIGVGIDNIKVFDPPANDASLTDVTPVIGDLTTYNVAGTAMNIGGTIFNMGSSPITSVVVKYQQGAGPITSNTVSGLNIAPFTSAPFTASTPYQLPSTVGEYDINVWVELTGDNNALNDSGATRFSTVAYMPKKKIMAEEATGTWCGWCPRGHVFMDSIANSPTHNASFSLAAVHNNDPMTVSAYDSKIGTIISGYPSMVIDRREVVDPSELFSVYADQKDYFGFADITLTDVPVGGFKYSVKATVKPAIDLSGDYRLALVLTEEDVRGGTSSWQQTNYYSYEYNNSPLKGAGLDWQAEPGHVPAEKMHYNHVARGIFPSADGASGSLPATMQANNTYDYTFTATMQPSWHRYNNHMTAIVMLIRNSDGHVLNSNNIVVPLGVKNVDAGIDQFMVYPNPANTNAYVNFTLAERSTVKVIVTDAIGRVMNVTNEQQYESGKHKVNVDLSNMSTGIYNVTLETDNGKISSRLSVIK